MAWALSSSGWKAEDISQRLGVEPKEIKNWISGKSSPSLKQLQETAKIVKRPLAVFFLSEPPAEPPLPKDYRVNPDRSGEFDKETLLAIRRARRLQKVSRDLIEDQKGSVDPAVDSVSIGEDPRKCAARQRARFAMDKDFYKGLRDSYDAFNSLRMLVEGSNVFVFQMRMPTEDARGFVLTDAFPAVIVVNSSDQIEARIFTLVHELGHVVLRKTGIDNPEMALGMSRLDQVERWCNEFAAEFLLPTELAKEVFQLDRNTLLEEETMIRLSKKLKVSKSMLLVRMKDLRFIEPGELNTALSDLRSRGIRHKEEGFGGETVDKRVIRERGRKFVELVARNVERGSLDYADAIDFLSIKLRDFDRVMAKASQ